MEHSSNNSIKRPLQNINYFDTPVQNGTAEEGFMSQEVKEERVEKILERKRIEENIDPDEYKDNEEGR